MPCYANTMNSKVKSGFTVCVCVCGGDSNHANVINKTLIGKRINEPEQVYYWEISKCNECDSFNFLGFFLLPTSFVSFFWEINTHISCSFIWTIKVSTLLWRNSFPAQFRMNDIFYDFILFLLFFFSEKNLLACWNMNKVKYMHFILSRLNYLWIMNRFFMLNWNSLRCWTSSWKCQFYK